MAFVIAGFFSRKAAFAFICGVGAVHVLQSLANTNHTSHVFPFPLHFLFSPSAIATIITTTNRKRYFQAAGAIGVKHMLPYLVEVAPALLRTRAGMNAVLECVALGDAKARKQIARGMKGDVLEWMRHPFGHLVLVRLLDVTDDTVMTKNTILKPCVAGTAAAAAAGRSQQEDELADLLCDACGCKLSLIHI